MILNINIDQDSYEIEIPQQLLEEGKLFFEKMDGDMNKGWQMGRFWIECPSDFQRCQVAANKIVDAFHKEDKRMFYLMAAYIMKKLPDTKSVTINTEFEIDEIDIID